MHVALAEGCDAWCNRIMATTADTLPDDPGTLKAMLLAERARAARLEQIIKELQRHRFGRRAETLPEDQLLLGLEEVEQVEASSDAATDAANAAERSSRAARRRRNRGALPAHLPRVEMLIDLDDHACPCCQQALHRIGEDVSERLDIVPAQFRVLVVRRPKYACRACETMVQAPAPARLIEAGYRPKPPWRRYSSPNMPTICRCIGRLKFTPARASSWIARPWPIGSGGPPSCCGRCMSGCSRG
jgi:hypothetical protein